MENDIFKTLQELKHIQPDSEYTKHSRMLVLAAPQHASPVLSDAPKLSTIFRLSTILGVGLASIFFILGGISYINETYSPLALEGLNQKSLVVEANEINSSIEITLGTIDYLNTSNQTTLKKIAEIRKTSTESAAAPMMMSVAAPEATFTDMDAFLIKSDATSAVSAEQQIEDVLKQVSE
jgi:hypothetical protein